MTTRIRPTRRLILLVALLIFLLLLCVLVILRFRPPGGRLSADAGGPYTIGEGQPLALDGSGSSGGNITSYAWDFGDGSAGSGIAPSHTYEDGPAQFEVRLTVTDDQGRTASDTTQVTVENLPPTVDAGGPYQCQVRETIQLAGICDDPGPLDATSLTCTWAEFSGTAISQPSYTCPDAATQVTLTLTATDKDGASAQDTATLDVVLVRLIADADGPYTGTPGVPVSFDGSGSSPAAAIVSYEWDFGDGQTGMGAVISHTYATAGVYTVTLTVGSARFEASDTTSATIRAVSQAPTAVIESEVIPKTEQCFRLDGSGSSDPDGQIVSYAWDLGDGATRSGEVIEYCYAEAGTYTVTLTVTDEGGATGSASVEVSTPVP